MLAFQVSRLVKGCLKYKTHFEVLRSLLGRLAQLEWVLIVVDRDNSVASLNNSDRL